MNMKNLRSNNIKSTVFIQSLFICLLFIAAFGWQKEYTVLPVLNVGDTHEGGIVFSLDANGHHAPNNFENQVS